MGLIANRGDYTPFSVAPATSSLTFDETHAYAPAVQRLALTGRLAVETDNYERRDAVAGVPFLPHAVLGGLGIVLGGAERAFIAADLVFPPVLFYLLYRLTGGLIADIRLRLSIAWLVVLIPFGPRNALWAGYDALVAPLDVTRTPQPELSFIVLLAALLALTRHLAGPSSGRTALIAGVASAAVVYSYYYYAIAWGLTLVLMCALAVVACRWRLAASTAGVAALAAVFAAPFVLLTLGQNGEGQTYLLERMGTFTRAPDMAGLMLAAAGAGSLAVAARRLLGSADGIRLTAMLCLVLAGVLGLNAHVLTGYDAQHGHFWNRLIQPVGLFVIMMAGARLAQARAPVFRASRRAITAGVAILVISAFARQGYAAARVADFHRSTRPETALLTWIRQNVEPGLVIGTVNPELILLLPAVTANFSYVPSGLRSLTPTREITTRFFELARFLELEPEDIADIASVPWDFGPPMLFWALGITGDAHVMAQQYAATRTTAPGMSGRLDYVVVEASPKGQRRSTNWSEADVVFRSERYRLVAVQQ